VSYRPNVPVPDELAQVRADIKRLEAREGELKRLLLLNEDLREGAAWLAEIKTVKRQIVDMKELRAMYPEQVEEHTYPREITQVVLSGISEDGEIVSARRFKKETQA
jgi:hypothetical protein